MGGPYIGTGNFNPIGGYHNLYMLLPNENHACFMAGSGGRRPVPQVVFEPKIISGKPEGWWKINGKEIQSPDYRQELAGKMDRNVTLYLLAIEGGMYNKESLSQMEIELDAAFAAIQAKLGDDSFRKSPFYSSLERYKNFEIPVEERV